MARPPVRRRALSTCLWPLLAASTAAAPAELPPPPDEVYGPLFAAVQRARLFPDQKTFADAVARRPAGDIVAEFAAAVPAPGGSELREFVAQRFLLPETPSLAVPAAESLRAHVEALWDLLRREPDRAVPGSSLLPLPQPYLVPGGRFREVYYWDSYFTMLGLRASGREDLIRSMVRNFAYQLDHYGLIPNGNRSYYLSRSQPPFLALMVELLAERHGEAVYAEFRRALRAEYAYWNDQTWPTRHRVVLPDGAVLQRYWDRRDGPRPEAFAEDEATAAAASRDAPAVWRDLRSAAESGWDFSSRWLADGRTLATIETTAYVPVDLNALLWQLETTLARAEAAGGDSARVAALRDAADARRAALARWCWSEAAGFFVDHHAGRQRPSETLTLAGLMPLFLGLATADQAAAVARVVEERFLQPGGLVTTLTETGQQWDWPNGWPPLQWMAIRGLERYGHDRLAGEITRRWIKLNRDVYARTGRLMEKYNVVDLSLTAGGGEYPAQDGFGWTNGVLLALLASE